MLFKTEPWSHQRESFGRAKDRDHFAFLYEPGCGKTKSSIDVCRYKFMKAGRILRTLTFAPPVVVPNWKDEWLKCSNLKPSDIILLQGSGKKRARDFEHYAFTDDPTYGRIPQGKIFVTNYEALLMPELYKLFQEWDPEVVKLDESHRCKSHASRRSKLMDGLCNPRHPKTKKLLPRPIVYLLTGTPVLNSPMDIFFQWKLLDGGAAFGRHFTRFRARYFRDRNEGMKLLADRQRYFPKWEVCTEEQDLFDGVGEIREKMAPFSHAVKKEDCLDLPPLVTKTIPVELSRAQQKMYQEMKRDFITYMDGQAVTANIALTKALRLLQISSGFVKTEEGKEVTLDNTPRVKALEELLNDLCPSGKVLVWAVFKRNYDQIREVCERAGLGYTELHGEVASGARARNIQAFRTDPNVRVLIGHPGSGGIGVNLIEAPYMVYFSRGCSLEHDLQSQARNYRGGSEVHSRVTRYDLVAPGTLEEMVVKRLQSKQAISEAVLREVRSELS